MADRTGPDLPLPSDRSGLAENRGHRQTHITSPPRQTRQTETQRDTEGQRVHDTETLDDRESKDSNAGGRTETERDRERQRKARTETKRET